jgi:hypothetical protein
MQSALIYFEADTVTAASLQSGLAQSGGPQVRFRGSEKDPINRSRAPMRAASGPLETFTVAVQSDRDLVAAGEALARANLKAWVTVMTAQGPQPMELAEYLRQRGLA